jgi:hypothetical protein
MLGVTGGAAGTARGSLRHRTIEPIQATARLRIGRPSSHGVSCAADLVAFPAGMAFSYPRRGRYGERL